MRSIFLNSIMAFCFAWLLFNSELVIYLSKVSYGQVNLLLHTQKVSEVLTNNSISKEEKQKLLWIEEIKKYSVDSLGYKPTNNYTTYYNQHNKPILWIITACRPFSFEAYEWKFPIVGYVSYKGFFKREDAKREFNKIYAQNYDTDISEVSAWSTLGWLPDPILSSMLKKSKGRIANLFFHELFHATYYAPSTVDVNENLANFIAEKATFQFLKNDSGALNSYIKTIHDDSVYKDFSLKSYEKLKQVYSSISKMSMNKQLKQKENTLLTIYKESFYLPLNYPKKYKEFNKQILLSKNAFFVDIKRYDGLYDSLNTVFYQKYGSNLKKMIEDLKK